MRSWSEACRVPGTSARHEVFGLAANSLYRLSCNGNSSGSLRSDASGCLSFKHTFRDASPQQFRLQPAQPGKS